MPVLVKTVLTGEGCSEEGLNTVELVSGICQSVVSRIAPQRLHTEVKPNLPKSADTVSPTTAIIVQAIAIRFRLFGVVRIERAVRPT
jgi:hypothetical protein